MARRCSSCQLEKPEEEFGHRSATSRRPNRNKQLHTCCRSCRNLKRRLSKRGLTESELQDLLDQQKWKCKLCDGDLPLYIDHDHETDRVRGLLCSRCNWRIGMLEKISGEWLERALKYTGLEEL